MPGKDKVNTLRKLLAVARERAEVARKRWLEASELVNLLEVKLDNAEWTKRSNLKEKP